MCEAMTPAEFAKRLNGRKYSEEWTRVDQAEAKRSGLIVIFGASDDLCEFRGVLYDEIGCYNGGDPIYLHRMAVLNPHETCECEYCGFHAMKTQCVSVTPIWDRDGISWQYETSIPHWTFYIMEGDEKYCRGIVFRADSIPLIG